MSQGGGQLHGVMVGRAIGSVVVSEDAWLGRLACGCAPFICLLACQQGTQMFSTGGAGFQQEEMPSPIPLPAVAQRMIRNWFAVSFCVLVAWGTKSRLMGQGGGCFLLNCLFFFPNPDPRGEREQGNE